MLVHKNFFIGSRWANPTGSEVLEVRSPITEEVFGVVPLSTNLDVDAAVAGARKAFDEGSWPHMALDERLGYLLRLSEILQPRSDEAIHLQIDEMGSPYRFISGVTKGSLNSASREAKEIGDIDRAEWRDGSAGKVLVSRKPIGVVATIIPWNGPFGQLIGALTPALLAGCPVIVKPAPEAPLDGYLVAEAAMEVGFPQGVLSIIPGGREVGEHLVTHPGVDRVMFTGSSAAGSRVASLCGKRLIGATLELGGKSAAIILDDADFEHILPSLLSSSLSNNGQVCYATTRILVSRRRSTELVERLVEAVEAMKIGNPHEPDTDFGPLVSERQRERVESYIESGRSQGATVATGGGRPADQTTGWYVEPTVFTRVDNSMRIAREEIFGPVVSVIDYEAEDDAIAIANDSEYGLGGAVFTSDPDRGIEIARRIRTGTCSINEAPGAGGGGPFGGTKRSGLGRKRQREGYEGYFEIQTVSLPPGYAPPAEAPSWHETA
jgi:aldehyde dehydrogenase (NAD+)